MKHTLKYFFLALIASLPTLSALQFYFGYESTINLIAVVTDSVPKTDNLKILLSERKIGYLHFLALILFIFSSICLLKVNLLHSNITEIFSKIRHSLILRIRIFLKEKIAIAFITMPLIVIFYYAINFPITNDEAATYLNYSSRSILSSISYYSHNNHILHSLFTNLMLNLPIPVVIAIRTPSIFVFLLTLIIFWSYVAEYMNKTIAFYSLGIFSTLYFSIYYGFVSRGYALVDLFFLLSIYAATKLKEMPTRNLLWCYLTMFSILGFYSIPSFLYPYVAINIWLLFQPNRNLKKQIASGIVVFIGVLLLYSPVLIVSGLQSIVPSSLGFAETAKLLPSFFYSALEDLTGVAPFFSVLILVFGFFFTYKFQFIRILFIILFLSLCGLLILQAVIPFSRTLIYFNFIIAIFSGLIIYKFFLIFNIKNQKSYIILATILPIQIAMIVNFKNIINERESFSLFIEKDIKLLKEAKSYLVISRTLDNYLLFYFKTRDKNSFTVNYISPKSFNLPEDNLNNDYILIDNEFLLATNRLPFLTNSHYSIFKAQ